MFALTFVTNLHTFVDICDLRSRCESEREVGEEEEERERAESEGGEGRRGEKVLSRCSLYKSTAPSLFL